MAEEEREKTEEGVTGSHQSLLQKFKDEPKWVKISALAGVAVLGVTVLLYFKNSGSGQSSQAGTSTGDALNGMGASTEMPGEGDIFPSLGTAGAAGAPGTSTGTSAPGTSSTGSTGASSSSSSTKAPPAAATTPKLISSSSSSKPAPAKKSTYKVGNNFVNTNKAAVNATAKRVQVASIKQSIASILGRPA